MGIELQTGDLQNIINIVNKIYDYVDYGIIVCDNTGRIVYANNIILKQENKQRNQLIGNSIINIHYLSEVDHFKKLKQVLETRKTILYEYDSKIAAGENHIKLSYSPIYNDLDSIIGMQISFFKITDNKKTIDSISKENDLSNRYLNILDEIILNLDVNGDIVYLNDSGHEILGYEPGELIGKNWFDLCIPKEDKDEIKNVFQKIMNGQLESVKKYEAPIVRKDGNDRIILWHNTILENEKGAIIGTVSSGKDITEKRNNEQEILRLDNKLKLAMQAAHLGLWEWNLKDDEVFFDEIALNMLHYSRDEIKGPLKKGSWWMQQVHPEDKTSMELAFNKYITGENREYEAEFRLKNKNGDYTWVSSHGKVLDYDTNGKPEVVIGIHRNISYRKNNELLIKENEEKFHNLAENALDAILIADNDQKYVYANKAASDLTGYSTDELMHMGLFDLTPVPESENAEKLWEHFIKQGKQSGEFIIICKNGEKKVAEYRAVSNYIEGLHLSILRDITIKKNMEETIKKSEKLLRETEKLSRIGGWEWDIEKQKATWTDEVYNIYNVSKSFDTANFQNILSFFHEDYKEKIQHAFDNAITNGEEYDLTVEFIDALGNKKWVRTIGKPVYENNKIIKIRGNFLDITEEKLRNEQIKESEERYNSLFHNSNDWVYVCDFNGRFIDANDAALKQMQYSKEELIKLTFPDIIDGQDLEKAYQVTKKLEHGIPQSKPIEYKVKRKNGSIAHIEAMASLIIRNGKPYAIQGIARDITEKKQAEKLLKDSKRRVNLILNSAADGIRIVNKDFIVTTMNDTFCKMIDIEKENGIGKKCHELFGSEKCGTDQCALHRVLRTGEGFDAEEIRITPDGKKIPCLVKVTPYYDETGSIIGAIEDYRDISERISAEKVISENEERFRVLFQSSNDAVFLIDENEKIFECNKKAEEMYAFEKNKVLNIHLKDFFKEAQPDETQLYEKFKAYMQRAFNGSPQKFDWIQKNKKNQTMYGYVRLNQIIINDNSYIQAVITDITEIKKRQILERQLASIVTHSEEAIIGSSLNGIISSWNNAAEQIYGYCADEVIGKNMSIIFPDNSKEEMEIILKKVKLGDVLRSHETKRKTKDGKIIDVSLTISPIRNDNNEIIGISSLGHDITDKKVAETRLIQAQKELKIINEHLEAIVKDRTIEIQRLLHQKDEFINQLGHDLKNPIGPFLSLIPVLQKKITDPTISKHLDILYRNSEHMKNIVVKMIKLAKLNSPDLKLEKEYINLHELVQFIIQKDKIFLDENEIEPIIDISSDIIIYVDKLQFIELLDNILNNAVKFTENKGQVFFSAKEIEDIYLIKIKDEGIGMNPDQLKRVFDEFYKGDPSRHDFDSSGLGMPICKKIVEKHKGRIWVESEGQGKGSTFFIEIPKSYNENNDARKITISEGR